MKAADGSASRPLSAESGRSLQTSWRRWGRAGALIAAGLVALAAGLYLGRGWLEGEADQKAAQALLAIELPDVDGKVQRVGQWQGRVLVVNFWATWCEPCKAEMPQFIKAQAAQGADGLQFVGIAVDSADKVQRFASDLGVNYPVLIGGLGAIELSRDLGNTLMALPFTIVLGRDGQVAYTQLGPIKDAKLQSIVKPLLAARG